MKIGIVSDSHGAALRLEASLKQLARQGAECIVHCGDIDDRGCLDVLAACSLDLYLTAGNMDRDFFALEDTCQLSGIHFGRRSIELQLEDGRWLVALHGHDEELFAELVSGGQFDYICHGHTHQRRDARIDGVRVINPGAVERADPLSAALLDTKTDELSFISLPQ